MPRNVTTGLFKVGLKEPGCNNLDVVPPFDMKFVCSRRKRLASRIMHVLLPEVGCLGASNLTECFPFEDVNQRLYQRLSAQRSTKIFISSLLRLTGSVQKTNKQKNPIKIRLFNRATLVIRSFLNPPARS